MQKLSRMLCLIITIILPTLSLGSTCNDIIYLIKRDLSRYSTNIQNQHLPWMNLVWLESRLGNGHGKPLPGDLIQYKWQCPEEDTYLQVVSANTGILTSVEGEYNSDNGSGIISANLTQAVPEAPVIATSPQTTSPITSPQVAPPSMPTPAAEPTKAIPNPTEMACETAAQQIKKDIDAFGIDVKNQHLSWMNLAWLQQNLGKPQSQQTVMEKFYDWDNYHLLIGADGSLAEIGSLPNGVKALTVNDAIVLIGQPKKTRTEELIQYKWTCPASNLIVLVNKSGLITYVNVQVNGSEASTKLNSTEFEKQFEIMLAEFLKPTDPQIQAQIQNYNFQFQTNFQKREEVEADMLMRLKQYYANIRECKSDTGLVAVPFMGNIIFANATIQGMQKGKCVVEFTYTVSGPKGMKTVTRSCKYLPESIALYTDQEAEKLVSGKYTYDSKNLTALQKAEASECKIK